MHVITPSSGSTIYDFGTEANRSDSDLSFSVSTIVFVSGFSVFAFSVPEVKADISCSFILPFESGFRVESLLSAFLFNGRGTVAA